MPNRRSLQRFHALLLVSMLASSASGQILQLGELTSTEIAALDRTRTVVLMPGGVLEQHGPYLPSFTDGYMNSWWTRHLAEKIVARPGWAVLVFPMLPLGHGGANEIGGKFVSPGSYGVSADTLRAIYMELGTELGEQGFRWVFVIQNHGSPLHNLAIDQAGDYFHDTYGGQMVNLCGLEPVDAIPAPALPKEVAQENGIDIHAGVSESSRMLFLEPHLVKPGLATATSFAATSPEQISEVARKKTWPGYFGAPRFATAAHGAAVMKQRLDLYARLALEILDGKDPRSIPRFSTLALVEEKEIVDARRKHDAAVRERQQQWLRKNGIN